MKWSKGVARWLVEHQRMTRNERDKAYFELTR